MIKDSPAAAATTAFSLSRIYAEGWASAMRLAGAVDPAEAVAMAGRLNPFAAGAERERWIAGFAAAIARRCKGGKGKRPGFRATTSQ